jgi:HSP20 family protein
MTLIDWTYSPVAELERMRRGMDELFERFGFSPGGGVAFPAVNLYDQGEDILVAVEVPGVPKDRLQVDLRENVLTLSGTRDPAPYENASPLREETPSGTFTKSLRLPAKVASDKVEAQYRNGILLIRCPKSEESRPKQIAIQA